MSQVENSIIVNEPDEQKIQLELVKLIMGVRYDRPAKLLLGAFQNITLSSGLSAETRSEILNGGTNWQGNLCRDLISNTLKGVIPPGGRTSQRLIKEIVRDATATLSVQDTDHQNTGVMKPDVRFNTKGGVVVFEHDNFITQNLLKYVYLVLIRSTNEMAESIDVEKHAIQKLFRIGVDTVRVQFFNGVGINIQQRNDHQNSAHTPNLNHTTERFVKDILRSLAHDIEKYEVDC